MKELIPIDLKGIIEEVKAEGKGRRVLWQDSESIAFLSSGRKERWDFHIRPGGRSDVATDRSAASGLSNTRRQRTNSRHKSRPNSPLPRRRAALAAPRGQFLVHCFRTQAPGRAKSIISDGSAISAARRFTKLR